MGTIRSVENSGNNKKCVNSGNNKKHIGNNGNQWMTTVWDAAWEQYVTPVGTMGTIGTVWGQWEQ